MAFLKKLLLLYVNTSDAIMKKNYDIVIYIFKQKSTILFYHSFHRKFGIQFVQSLN